MLRFLTAGESHGPSLTAIIEGMPSGVPFDVEHINMALAERQKGFGRGGRMKIERDHAQIVSGVREGVTIGSPIAILISNLDWENWKRRDPKTIRITRPRPGHADFAGAMKYNHRDIRNVLERASARETAVRVAVGAVAKLLLRQFGVDILGYVVEVGGVAAPDEVVGTADQIRTRLRNSRLRCPNHQVDVKMVSRVEEAVQARDTVGGVVQVVAWGVPVGLGSYTHWDRRLDGRLAQALMSIQAIKGVEIGAAWRAAKMPGSHVHDEIFYEPSRGYYRQTNRAGGIEGGVSNGEPIWVRAAMKPLSTLRKPLRSVDLETKEAVRAVHERSDVCAVPAAAIVAEAMVAWVLADAWCEKFGGDSLEEMRRNVEGYRQALKRR